MFDELLEKIKTVDLLESKLLSIFEGKSWEHIAKALYQVLDDIDTADDMCKENSEAFRNMVMKLQAKKNQYMYSPDGYDVVRVDECVCHIYDMRDDELLDFYRKVLLGPENYASAGAQEQYPKDKAETEKEIEIRGLEIPVTEVINENHCAGDKHNTKTLLEGTVSCLACGQDMNESDSCSAPYMGIGSDYYKRDTSYFDVNERCHNCSILNEEGNIHHPRCDIERCPRCAKQNITCACNRFGKEYLEELPDEVTAKEAKVKIKESGWRVFYKDYSTEPSTEVEMKKRFEVETEQEALAQAEELLGKEAAGGEWEVTRAEKINENLTSHARRELELAGMFNEEVDGSEAAGSWNRLCAEAVIELMTVFAGQGHSGFSASMTQDLFSRLANYEPLTELTDNSDEWNDISEMQSGEPGWQSQRSPSCFSEDGGKTYWDIDEEYYIREDEDGERYISGLSEEEWNNRPMHTSKHVEK